MASFLAIARIRLERRVDMIDNKYPLFSPELMQSNSFSKIAEGFRSSDPGELVSGAVSVALERKDKKVDPENPYFSQAYRFAETSGFDLCFFK